MPIPVLTISVETWVIFLGNFISTETHFLLPTTHERGRTMPCQGTSCPHCRQGIERRRNFYAPALAHTRGDLDEESKPIWQRVVFFAPHGARALFGNAHQRGRKYRCQRIRVGCVLQLRAAFLDLVADGDKLPPEFDVRPILEAASRDGFPAESDRLHEIAATTPGGRAVRLSALLGIGQAVVQRLPDAVVTAYLPYHTLDVVHGEPRPREITVRFRSLVQVRGVGGTVYHSRRRPTLPVDGRDRVVGFSDHAVRRMGERGTHHWRSYPGMLDAFAYLENCVYFEDVSDRFAGPCFALYDRCAEGYYSGHLAEVVLGHPVSSGDGYHYRVGYCPAVVEGNYLKAKTILMAGMDDTPEHRAFRRARPSPDERSALTQSLGHLHSGQYRELGDYEILRWFHHNGIPQVIRLDRNVFCFD